jgi:hypothetical protein
MSSLASSLSFSSRPPEPPQDAAALLAEIRERGGRVYPMRGDAVFCLTDSAELAEWLLKLGGKPFNPRNNMHQHTPGAYLRAPGGKIEFDIWIHQIPTADRPLREALRA